jgi:hypothetical protein
VLLHVQHQTFPRSLFIFSFNVLIGIELACIVCVHLHFMYTSRQAVWHDYIIANVFLALI